MDKKKRITIQGTIYLYASAKDRVPSAMKVYKSLAQRKRIVEIWKRMYQLENKPFYIIQIAPDVN